jgi:hypothetical protein
MGCTQLHAARSLLRSWCCKPSEILVLNAGQYQSYAGLAKKNTPCTPHDRGGKDVVPAARNDYVAARLDSGRRAVPGALNRLNGAVAHHVKI